MAFQHATAPYRPRHENLLSTDNAKPDRFALIDALRGAASALDFGPSVVATVDALLSCLPPKRNHDLVFASNATLVLRRNGISDRTLRRHLAQLVAAGLLIRMDSPNGKRYARRDPANGMVLRFGLDLAPLFAAFNRLQSLAHDLTLATARTAYLRAKLRVAIRQSLEAGAAPELIAQAQRALRRKLSANELDGWLARLQRDALGQATDCHETTDDAPQMSGSNGQNVRHQQNSIKEIIDQEKEPADTAPQIEPLTMNSLIEACPQAAELLPEQPRTEADIIQHARTLAPMIGIDRQSYDAAEARHGILGAALTIWGLLEMLGHVQKPAAYFRSITVGSRSSAFSPWQFIRQIIQRSLRQIKDCPRTTADTCPAT